MEGILTYDMHPETIKLNERLDLIISAMEAYSVFSVLLNDNDDIDELFTAEPAKEDFSFVDNLSYEEYCELLGIAYESIDFDEEVDMVALEASVTSFEKQEIINKAKVVLESLKAKTSNNYYSEVNIQAFQSQVAAELRKSGIGGKKGDDDGRIRYATRQVCPKVLDDAIVQEKKSKLDMRGTETSKITDISSRGEAPEKKETVVKTQPVTEKKGGLLASIGEFFASIIRWFRKLFTGSDGKTAETVEKEIIQGFDPDKFISNGMAIYDRLLAAKDKVTATKILQEFVDYVNNGKDYIKKERDRIDENYKPVKRVLHFDFFLTKAERYEKRQLVVVEKQEEALRVFKDMIEVYAKSIIHNRKNEQKDLRKASKENKPNVKDINKLSRQEETAQIASEKARVLAAIGKG